MGIRGIMVGMMRMQGIRVEMREIGVGVWRIRCGNERNQIENLRIGVE